MAAVTDRVTVILLSLATFFVLLGFLAKEAEPSGTSLSTKPAAVLRRIYETTVVETVPANSNIRGGVSQSVSGLMGPVSAAPTTRTS